MKEKKKLTQASHQRALQQKHDELERQIDEEEHRPMPDAALVQELKRRKLRVREEMFGL